MRLAGIDIAIFVIYIVLVIGVGLYSSRKVGGSKRDYFLAGDKLPWWMVGGSIVAANISTHHFVGVMGMAYSMGFVAMTVEWGAILIGFNALLWVFLPFYLRNGFFTMPEFLEKRFGNGARTLFAALIVLTYVFVEISAVLYLGAVALHSMLNIPMNYSIVAMALFTGVYTIAGGLRAVVWTEMVQLVVLLTGGIILSVATLNHIGGFSAFLETSKNWDLLLPADNPDMPWTMYLGGVVCISIFYCAANQFIVQRTLAAKDEWHARMGVVFTDYLKFLLPLIIIVPGIVAPQIFPNLEQADETFPLLVKKLLPAGLVGLVMAGLIAAVMSHVSGAINSCTTILTVDFYLPFINKEATDRQAVRFGKIMGAVLVIMGIFWAFVLIDKAGKGVFLYLLDAYGYITPGIAAMFLVGIFWKRATQAGAIAAGVLTIPLSFGVHEASLLLPPHIGSYITPFFARTGIVFWLCILACIGFSYMQRRKSDEELTGMIWTKESLKLPEHMRDRMRGLKNPTFWWAIVTAAVLYFYIRYY